MNVNLLILIHVLPLFILMFMGAASALRDELSIGTRSVLYGYHQFLIHPLFVAWGWWKLYGFPWDPRLWVAFFVHDLGYIGKPNMDGDEGEQHPWVGATIMGELFDYRDQFGHRRPLRSPFTEFIGRPLDFIFGSCPHGMTWYCFAFYHSRFLCKRYETEPSKLCYADKLAIVIAPTWLQLRLMNFTGEIHEYMECKEQGRTNGEGLPQREWVEKMKDEVRGIVSEKTETCVVCHEDCSKHAWMCDQAPGFPLWCQRCFEQTPCWRGEHGEGCPTMIAELKA